MSTKEQIANVNARLSVLLAEAKQALLGEREFGPEQVHALREPITEMDSIMLRSKELRLLEPGIGDALDLYKSQLHDLQGTLEKVRMMLLARQANLCASRVQLTAVDRWARRLDQTR